MSYVLFRLNPWEWAVTVELSGFAITWRGFAKRRAAVSFVIAELS